MRCILCDRCKKVVEDWRKIRAVTFARPLFVDASAKTVDRADKASTNDILWTKELCQDCADELESFMSQEDNSESGDSSGDNG